MNRGIGQGKGGGRPTTITPEKVSVLLTAFEHGFSTQEALQHANIAKSTYERKKANDPKFRDQIWAAQMKLVLMAKVSLANSIREGDMPTVRWYLERKCPEEFGRHTQPESDDWDMRNITVVLPGSKPHPRIIPEKTY